MAERLPEHPDLEAGSTPVDSAPACGMSTFTAISFAAKLGSRVKATADKVKADAASHAQAVKAAALAAKACAENPEAHTAAEQPHDPSRAAGPSSSEPILVRACSN